MGGEYRAGDVVDGRFVLKEQLGSGGMGTVWRAHHRHLEIDVALKQLLIPATDAAEIPEEPAARARREGRTLARLPAHPNIVSVRDLITVDGIPWLVMDLIEGRSLKETVFRDGPLTDERTAALAEQLLTALRFVHDHGVLHRDLKPGNILIDSGDTRRSAATIRVRRFTPRSMSARCSNRLRGRWPSSSKTSWRPPRPTAPRRRRPWTASTPCERRSRPSLPRPRPDPARQRTLAHPGRVRPAYRPPRRSFPPTPARTAWQ
ncbi:serine/threonine-protein kinase [Actinoallomurus sp. NPDC052274]|uniref:serine/threonine-protein kinase n=1 Tax=Actinoallomurus sp. NPDC052274 TaxID=3155420 RepID=UPI00342DC367